MRVEEDSAEQLLRHLLAPLRRAGNSVSVRRFQGKPDLLEALPRLLRGYARAAASDTSLRVVVLVDADTEACVDLKRRLDRMAIDARVASRSPSDSRLIVLNRIAVRELEAWYFGDWAAIRVAYPKCPRKPPSQCRNPDAVHAKTSDVFKRVLRNAGYQNAISKVRWAEQIGPELDPSRNSSASFRAFWTGVSELVR